MVGQKSISFTWSVTMATKQLFSTSRKKLNNNILVSDAHKSNKIWVYMFLGILLIHLHFWDGFIHIFQFPSFIMSDIIIDFTMQKGKIDAEKLTLAPSAMCVCMCVHACACPQH